MQDLKEFITVQIDSPIKCQVNIDGKNQFADIDTIYLKAFNVKEHKNITLPLRNQYKRMRLSTMSLLKDLVDKNPDANIEDVKEDEQKTIDGGIELLSLFDGDELALFYDKFQKFLCANIAFKDELYKNPLSAVDFTLLDINDLEKIIASYIVVFFTQYWKI